MNSKKLSSKGNVGVNCIEDDTGEVLIDLCVKYYVRLQINSRSL